MEDNPNDYVDIKVISEQEYNRLQEIKSKKQIKFEESLKSKKSQS